MLIRRISTALNVQRILEGYLLIRLCTIIQRDSLLKRLEIEEIQRIAEVVEELPDAFPIDMFRLIQRTLYLHLLLVAKLLATQVFKRDTACIIVLQLLRKVHAIEVENGWLVIRHTMLTFAII